MPYNFNIGQTNVGNSEIGAIYVGNQQIGKAVISDGTNLKYPYYLSFPIIDNITNGHLDLARNIPYDQQVQIEIIANDGYDLPAGTDVIVDGCEFVREGESYYTLWNPAKEVTITATCPKHYTPPPPPEKTYTVTWHIGGLMFKDGTHEYSEIVAEGADSILDGTRFAFDQLHMESTPTGEISSNVIDDGGSWYVRNVQYDQDAYVNFPYKVCEIRYQNGDSTEYLYPYYRDPTNPTQKEVFHLHDEFGNDFYLDPDVEVEWYAYAIETTPAFDYIDGEEEPHIPNDAISVAFDAHIYSEYVGDGQYITDMTVDICRRDCEIDFDYGR